jgi:hypothetical protein
VFEELNDFTDVNIFFLILELAILSPGVFELLNLGDQIDRIQVALVALLKLLEKNQNEHIKEDVVGDKNETDEKDRCKSYDRR